jgi:hypothetical protein
LPGEVIDDGKDAEAAAVHRRVHDGVERPAQVPVPRDRRPLEPVATPALAHGEPLFLVKPVELLVVEPDALASQQQDEATIAEPPTLGGQLAQPGPKFFIVSPLGGVATSLRVQPDEATGPSLRITLPLHRPGHGFLPQAGRQKFFPSISRSVAASSAVSASSFLSLRFSSSSANSLRASEISIPPKRDRHS